MDRDTFLDHLRESRLLSDKQVREIAGEFRADNSTQAIATSLISRGLLTPFQVRRLTEGQGRGLILGQYRLLEEAGQGGFGRVYKALHAVMGRVVAVKVISPQAAEDARARSWFKREVQAATQLYHPNIVMAYDANEAEGLLFLVMEYIEGSDLESLVRRQGPLPISLACEMMRQAAGALQYASERGMVHRDIKPANLLIPRARSALDGGGPGGPGVSPGVSPIAVKIVDFGLARLHRPMSPDSLSSQSEKRFVGTPDYVSPEQARNAGAVDIRSDLYSLGCTFYYAVAGRKPFQGETVFEVVVKHLEEEPRPLETLRPEVPPAVAAVVRRLMAKDPARRFQTPGELVEELDFLCGSPLASGGRPAAEAAPVPQPPDNRRSPEPPSAQDGPAATRVVAQLALENRPAAPCSVTDEAAPVGIPPLSDLSPPTLRKEELQLPSPPEDTWTAEEPPPPTASALRSCWRQWVAIVEAFARGREPPLDEQAYRRLHREVLAACRSRALPRLESLVEPWLAPAAFASADRATLSSLLDCCRRVEQEVFGPSESWNLARWAALVMVGLIAGAVGLYWRGVRVGAVPAKPSLAALGEAVATHPVLSLTVGMPLVILLSISLVSRLLRS